MPNFSVPNQINAGDPLDATKAMANWNQVVTDLNGAKVDNTNIAAGAGILGTQLANNTLTAAQMNTAFANGNVEPAFSTYKTILERKSVSGVAPSSGTYSLVEGSTAVSAGGPYSPIVFYFDPAAWTAGSRTTKLRVQANMVPNAANPGVNFTFGLYPVGTTGGGLSAVPTLATFGTVVAGSTAAIIAPTGQSQANSGDFTAPVAGYYFFGVLLSGGAAANSVLSYRCELQVRQV